METWQIGVFLGYASRLGHALLDRELSLPTAWPNEPARCQQAGLPAERRFATTPPRAPHLRPRAPGRWGTGDRVDGHARRRRRWVEAQPWAAGRAVSSQDQGWLGWQPRQVKTLLGALPEDRGTRVSAGHGAQGPRWDAWQQLPWADPVAPPWRRWRLVRRSMRAPTARPAYGVLAPQATALAEVVRVAGRRWTLESGFAAAKGEVGLDDDEVRRWTGWYRPSTLAMWADARLAVLRAGAIAVEARKKSPLAPQMGSHLAAFKAGRGLACR